MLRRKQSSKPIDILREAINTEARSNPGFCAIEQLFLIFEKSTKTVPCFFGLNNPESDLNFIIRHLDLSTAVKHLGKTPWKGGRKRRRIS
jgi:hypothetical protein